MDDYSVLVISHDTTYWEKAFATCQNDVNIINPSNNGFNPPNLTLYKIIILHTPNNLQEIEQIRERYHYVLLSFMTNDDESLALSAYRTGADMCVQLPPDTQVIEGIIRAWQRRLQLSCRRIPFTENSH